MKPISQASQYKPDFAILDCLRGIAAIYVVINHCRGHLLIGGSELAQQIPVANWTIFDKLYYTILRLTALGEEFVILFFVLSGYSIAYSISRGGTMGQFYTRRFIRLYPPLIVALCWAALVFYLISVFEPVLNQGMKSVFDSWKSTLLNFTYISNGAYIAQFWSLVHEVIFYILAPTLSLIFIRKRRKEYYYYLSIIFYIIGWIYPARPIPILSKFIFDYNIYFVVGVWLFHNYNFVKDKITMKKTLVYVIFFFSICLLSIMKLKLGENRITNLFAAILSVYLIVNFQQNGIKSKLLLFLGAMSYTLYITHFASMKLFNLVLVELKIAPLYGKITIPYIWLIGIPICVLFSYIFYLIAEKPAKGILSKLRK